MREALQHIDYANITILLSLIVRGQGRRVLVVGWRCRECYMTYESETPPPECLSCAASGDYLEHVEPGEIAGERVGNPGAIPRAEGPTRKTRRFDDAGSDTEPELRYRKHWAAMEQHGADAMLLLKIENMLYLTGLYEICSAALIAKDQEPLAFVFDKHLDDARSASWLNAASIIPFHKPPGRGLFEVISGTINKRGLGSSIIAFEGDFMTAGKLQRLKKNLPQVNFLEAPQFVTWTWFDEIRMAKSEIEIEYLRKATEIANYGMLAAVKALKPGVKEIEVAAEAEYEMRKRGMERSSFKTHLASGERSLLAHPYASQKIIEKGDWISIDLGACYKGYCSDLARSFFVGAEPTKTQKHLYRTLVEAAHAGFSTMRPDAPTSLVDKNARIIVERNGFGKFFPPYCGHGSGVRRFEPPPIHPNSSGTIQSGMVITIFEVGIYVPGVGGARFEDTVEVRKDKTSYLIDPPMNPHELVVV